jgi:hypothetical protein
VNTSAGAGDSSKKLPPLAAVRFKVAVAIVFLLESRQIR